MALSLIDLQKLFGIDANTMPGLIDALKMRAAAGANMATGAANTVSDLAGDLRRNPGRIAGFMSDPQSYRDMARNALDVVGGLSRGGADLVGGSVDIANTLMRGVGGEKPFMGSKWIEDTFYPPARGTGPETVGRLASMVFNPASAAMKAGPAMYAAERALIRNADLGNLMVAGSPEAQVGAIGKRAAKNVGKGPVGAIDFKSMTPAERQAAALNDIHIKQMPDGSYVGSPDITSGAQLGAMRKRLYGEMRGIMEKPWVNQYLPWYQRQREGVMEVAGADPVKQTRAASGIGVYSPQSDPATNYTSMANQMVHGAYTGDPFSMQRTGAQMRNFGLELSGGRQATQGPKTANFARSSDPTRFDPDMATNDIWVGRFLGYEGGNFSRGFTQAEHGFVQGEMQRMTAIANREKWGGKSDWHVEEMQALPWVEYKAKSLMEKRGMTYDEGIREAMKTTLEALPRNEMVLNNEFVTGAASGHLPGVTQGGPELKMQYTMEPGNFIDPRTGRNVFIQSLPNALEREAIPFVGKYKDESSPGYATRAVIEREKGLRPNPLWAAMNEPLNPFEAAVKAEKGSAEPFKRITPAYGTAVPPFPTWADAPTPTTFPTYSGKLKPPKPEKYVPAPTPVTSGLPRVAADEPFVSPSSENAMQVIQALHGGFGAQEGSVGSSFFRTPAGSSPGVNSVMLDTPGKRTALADILAAEQTGAPHGLPNAVHLGDGRILLTNFDSKAFPKINDETIRNIMGSVPSGTDVRPGIRRSIPGAWYDEQWAQPQGSGAVTMAMLNDIYKDPVQGRYLLSQFDKNPQVSEQILAQVPRDERYSVMTQTPVRPDLQKLRTDAGTEGLLNFFERIKKAGSAAGYPALALGLLAPELLRQRAAEESPYQ